LESVPVLNAKRPARKKAARPARPTRISRVIDDAKVRFGALVRQARQDAGLSQNDLAKLLGKDQPGVSNLERGQNLTLSTMANIADKLGMDLTFEFRQRDPKP
jgi:ribosome-binding protein aMBF1 (putative translation factor)